MIEKVGAINVFEYPPDSGDIVAVQETAPRKWGLINVPGGGRNSKPETRPEVNSLTKPETLIECVIRETEEESGLLTEPKGIIAILDYLDGVHVAFASVAVDGELRPAEEHPWVGTFSREAFTDLHRHEQTRSQAVMDVVDAYFDEALVPLSFLRTYAYDKTRPSGLVVAETEAVLAERPPVPPPPPGNSLSVSL